MRPKILSQHCQIRVEKNQSKLRAVHHWSEAPELLSIEKWPDRSRQQEVDDRTRKDHGNLLHAQPLNASMCRYDQAAHRHSPDLDNKSKPFDGEQSSARANVNLEDSHPNQSGHPSMAQLVWKNRQGKKHLENEEVDEYPPHSHFRPSERKHQPQRTKPKIVKENPFSGGVLALEPTGGAVSEDQLRKGFAPL